MPSLQGQGSLRERTMATPATGDGSSYTPALTLLTALFFAWGLLTSLNDILVPHLKAVFTLSYVQAMLIQLCFFGAYLTTSIPAGYLVEKVGYRRGMVYGLSAAAVGCLGFYPAASERSYPLFLAALFVLASGITLLQVAANPCVASLGRPETAASRLNLTQAFNSLGTVVGPLLGASLILSSAPGGEDPAQAVHAVQGPYLTLAALLFLVAVVFARLRLPALSASDAAASAPRADEKPLLSRRHLMLGVGAIFLYVGGEVAIGSFLVNFMAQPEIAGLPEQVAGRYLALYWGGAMVGRFLGSALMRKVPPGRVLAASAACAMALLLVGIGARGPSAMWALLAIGLFNSIMFPTIFTLAIAELGPRTGEGSGLLCTAIVGGAIMPVIMGYFADQIGIQPAFFVPLACYAYIVHYGLRGHLVR